LLVLSDREIFDYLCTGCGSSVGRREVTAGEKMLAQAMARRRPRRSVRLRQLTPQFEMCIVFMGTGEIGVPTLRALLKSEHYVVAVVTQADKPAGRAQLIEPTPVKQTVTTANVLVLQPARIKEHQAIAEIRALIPDAIVVMAYGQILPRDVLEIPKIASLNLHAS